MTDDTRRRLLRLDDRLAAAVGAIEVAAELLNNNQESLANHYTHRALRLTAQVESDDRYKPCFGEEHIVAVIAKNIGAQALELTVR